MAERDAGWRADLERRLEPFLARLPHPARRATCPPHVAGPIAPGERKRVQPLARRPGLGGHDGLPRCASAPGKNASRRTLVSPTLARDAVPVPVALRPFLPEAWTGDPARPRGAGAPAERRPDQARGRGDRARPGRPAAGVGLGAVPADAGGLRHQRRLSPGAPGTRARPGGGHPARPRGARGRRRDGPTSARAPARAPAARPRPGGHRRRIRAGRAALAGDHPAAGHQGTSARRVRRSARAGGRRAGRPPARARRPAQARRGGGGPWASGAPRASARATAPTRPPTPAGAHRRLPPRRALGRLPPAVPAATDRARGARWPCERARHQRKQELGLDHFEGRSWTGLHRRALLT